MDFGKLPENKLAGVDFSLPAEPAENQLVLPGKKAQQPKIYVGCPRWGVKEWVGKIYPKGTKATDFLDQYVKHFNCIELNATHYQIYSPEAISKWGVKAKGHSFKFCPKIPQSISHQSDFIEVEAPTAAYIEGIRAFGDNLGPIFLQVSDKYGPDKKANLFNYLRSLPEDLSFFLEVRHPAWFSNAAIRKELFDTLRSLHTGAVITDTAGRRDCVHMNLTIPKAFVRFVSNSLHTSDFTRINDWMERIKYWLDNGLEELYFILHMPDEAFSPELAVYVADKMKAICGVELMKPVFIKPSSPAQGTQISFFD